MRVCVYYHKPQRGTAAWYMHSINMRSAATVSSVVCLTCLLDPLVSPAKTAELIEMPMWIRVGARNRVLDSAITNFREDRCGLLLPLL